MTVSESSGTILAIIDTHSLAPLPLLQQGIILRHTLFLTTFGILLYFAISTVLADAALIGSVGAFLAKANRALFGYLAFIYPFALFWPWGSFYRDGTLSIERTERILALLLLFFALLICQALIVTDTFRGALGSGFVDFLHPYIGGFGLWVLFGVAVSISAVMLYDAKWFSKIPSALRKREKRVEPKLVVRDPIMEPEVRSPGESAPFDTFEEESIAEETLTFEEMESMTALDTPAFERRGLKIEPEPDEGEEENKTFDTLFEAETLEPETPKGKAALVVEELDENRKLLDAIERGRSEKPKNFKLPALDFLQKPPKQRGRIDEKELDDKIRDLIQKLAHFKIEGDVIRTYAGPVVSTFEFKPAANIKVSKILNLQDDLAMALRAETIRIQAPIPGKDVVGIEIPNHAVETIYLREIFESKLFKEAKSPLTIALGKDIVGNPFITDLKKLPHLLIAGTTGSGKSVGINAMILSLLYKNAPDQLRLLMIDPKMLEFSIYNDIPHLLTPVITKAKQAIAALNNTVGEMERRYQLMSESRVKNIENYNEKMKRDGGQPFPYIVVVIDELADLMMTSGKDVEYSIARLAQMARASGIHLIVATQRPSVDVVTGLIKANLPSRISYRVGQRVDSKIILDAQGAESLLGRGDMLFTPPGATGLIRLHAPWSTEDEIDTIVEFLKSQREPQYDESFLADAGTDGSGSGDEGMIDEMDELYDEAKAIVLADRKTSISYLQRKLQIGYNRAARIIEQMELRGLLSAPNAKGNRDIIG